MRITREMVARQAGFARRSVRDIARDPAVGREFPRLVATLGRSTVRLRMPWLPFRLIDRLDEVVGAGSTVFEYGGGGSTLWFLDHGATVVTVEHEPAWADVLERTATSRAPAGRWSLLRRSSDDAFAAYVAAIEDYDDDHFDVVVVDGRERARCAVAALPKVRPGGLLIVDDTDRERYAAALDTVGWPREDVVGFSPAKPTLAYTTVFTRPLG